MKPPDCNGGTVVTKNDSELLQPSEFVISTIYVPPVKPVTVVPVCPFTFELQFIVYADIGGVKPVINILPLPPAPKQLASLTTYPPNVNPVDGVKITEAVIPVHPPPSLATI